MRFSPGTSQDDIIAAEKFFKDRPVANWAPNRGNSPRPEESFVRDVERPVVNWAPNRGNSPVRDVVNPPLTGFNFPGKEQESDTILDSYRSLLNKLNLSKRARSR
jgi:hypothetical protein